MAKIPVGNFGNNVAQGSPAARLTPSNSTEGLVQFGNKMMQIAADLNEQSALTEATTTFYGARRELTDLLTKYKTTAVDSKGKPIFENGMTEFESDSAKILRKYTGEAKSSLARNMVAKQLAKTIESDRESLGEHFIKQKKDWNYTSLFDNYKKEMQAANLPGVENTLGVMVQIGAINTEKAYELKGQAESSIEYGNMFTNINAAQTKDQLFEIRGKLGVYNPKLSKTDNESLMRLTQNRIDSIDKEADRTAHTEQENVIKQLDSDYRDGTLTVEKVKQFEHKIPATEYRRLLALPQIHSLQGDINESDQENWVQQLERDMLINSRNPGQLEKLRGRVVDLTTGYDPKTGVYGPPKLSRDTGMRLKDDIERYQRELRTERRQNDADVRLLGNEEKRRSASEYRDVEQLLTRVISDYKDSRIGPDAQRDASKTELQLREDLLRHKDDPTKWWDNFKKNRQDLFKQTKRMPSFVPMGASGKPDFDAAKRNVLKSMKADSKPGSKEKYNKQFDEIMRLEREYDN
ncbi:MULTISPECIES: hypothetical protein [unclassified Methylophilus]|uniref:hypothetical protein n=1 Tax=unclassified Methylophilus TaxID=2630143 RepID=UPI000368A743|nr:MULTISPECIES: hypothetical protein [unclassified Methylophilus]